MILRADGLRKAYRAPDGSPLAVLSDVSVEFGPGQLAVVTGPSGSGKSTLLNLLGLLEDPDAGDVWFGDTRVTGLPRSGKSRARGASVGFVFQSFLLLPSLTALDLLAELGLSARVRHFPPQLSGGEQQRVAFCRAVLNDPPLLLADEPTGNLDDENGRVILDQLRRRARAGGCVVVVTHRADLAEGATTVLRLNGGRLVSGRVPTRL